MERLYFNSEAFIHYFGYYLFKLYFYCYYAYWETWRWSTRTEKSRAVASSVEE